MAGVTPASMIKAGTEVSLGAFQNLALYLMNAFLSARLMIRTFGLDKETENQEVVGALSNEVISDDLVEIRRIDT